MSMTKYGAVESDVAKTAQHRQDGEQQRKQAEADLKKEAEKRVKK